MGNQSNQSQNKKPFEPKNFLRSFLLAHKKAIEYISTQNKNNPENEKTFAENTGEGRTGWTDKSIAIGTIVLAVCTFILCGATIFLAIYTAGLFNDASTSTTLAKQTHQSDSTLTYRRFISDSQLANKRFQNETATINKQIAIANKGLQQQINSLNETQKDFNIENQPFLEVAVPLHMGTIEIGKPIIVTYDVKNLGKYPVKIIEEVAIIVPIYNRPNFNFALRDTNLSNANRYITYDSPLEEEIQTRYLDSSYFTAIQNKHMPLYMFGFIKYLNLVNKQKREYDYMIKIEIEGRQLYVDFKINDNKDIP